MSFALPLDLRQSQAMPCANQFQHEHYSIRRLFNNLYIVLQELICELEVRFSAVHPIDMLRGVLKVTCERTGSREERTFKGLEPNDPITLLTPSVFLVQFCNMWQVNVGLPCALVVKEAVCSLLKLLCDCLWFFVSLKPSLILLVKSPALILERLSR